MPLDPIAQVRLALGLPSAPVVNRGVATTIAFFENDLHIDPLKWIDYLRGIDFHAVVPRASNSFDDPLPTAVRRELLPTFTRLARHRSTGPARSKPFLYFTTPGTSPFSTGTSFPESQFELFECSAPIWALKSRASSISFGPTDRVSRMGGGLQYIIPASAEHLLRRVHAPRR